MTDLLDFSRKYIDRHKGMRVVLTDSHPEAGKIGTFVDLHFIQGTNIDVPVVRLDDGRRVNVMHPDQWRPL